MRKRYAIACCVTAIAILASCSTINVVNVKNTVTTDQSEGIYYALPKTVVRASVTVERTDKVQGPFSSYAAKYLGLSNVITDNSTSYSISSATINTSTIPDPDQYYFIETRNLKKARLMLDLGEYSILEGVNNRMLKSKWVDKDSSFALADDIALIPEQNFINPNIGEAFDTIIEKINLDTTYIVKKTLKKVYIEKTTEQKAKEAADFILALEEARISLLTGYSEVNYSMETVQYMVEKLEKLKEEYVSLFTGITVKHTQKYYFSYIPQAGYNDVNLPIFRFSEKYGICDTSDYKGDNVYLDIKSSGSTIGIKAYELNRAYTKEKHKGIYYRIPEKADISLYYIDKKLVTSKFMIAQFGAVSELQAKGIRSLKLDPESGSIEKIVYAKKGFLSRMHH